MSKKGIIRLILLYLVRKRDFQLIKIDKTIIGYYILLWLDSNSIIQMITYLK